MKQRGFTLVEMLVVLLVFSLATAVFAHSLLGRAKKSADVNAVKTLLSLAARRSIVEAKHFGVHFDSTLHTASLFVDRNGDDLYSGTDTLSSIARLSPLGRVDVATTAAAPMGDVCFKKNGAVSSGNSFEIVLVGVNGDSSKMQVIAASGRVLGP
ncbi:MAG TPA: prepilin-type N-terminal cleavage/methylation domain-containing protein [Fibrobacteria bacterium]|nr:prepilin-type N-terminal cleavage/methylation domain-containing protein [Fibrobacteria bacterium]